MKVSTALNSTLEGMWIIQLIDNEVVFSTSGAQPQIFGRQAQIIKYAQLKPKHSLFPPPTNEKTKCSQNVGKTTVGMPIYYGYTPKS